MRKLNHYYLSRPSELRGDFLLFKTEKARSLKISGVFGA